jgi:hypothetical protein
MLNYLLTSWLICSAEKFTYCSFLLLTCKKMKFMNPVSISCTHPAGLMQHLCICFSINLEGSRELRFVVLFANNVQSVDALQLWISKAITSRVMIPSEFEWLPVNCSTPYSDLSVSLDKTVWKWWLTLLRGIWSWFYISDISLIDDIVGWPPASWLVGHFGIPCLASSSYHFAIHICSSNAATTG